MIILLIVCIVVNILCALIGLDMLGYEWTLIRKLKKEKRDEHNHNDKDANQDSV